jgi:lipopolysaccharide biosynthesis glycosyltransferase
MLSTEPNTHVSASVEDRVPLLLCTNAGYLQHVAVCVTSLLANTPELFFEIVVVGGAGERLDKEKLRRTLERFPNQSLTFREFSPPPDCVLPMNPLAHYTADSWNRLWIGDFFPPQVNRALYLDGDIVIVGSIAPLWRTDLAGALLGAVDIPGSQAGVHRHGLRPEVGYFNAGVLLIDLDQWRKTGALETALNYAAAHPDRLNDIDQDALNACFHGRRKRLEYKWNVIWPFYRELLALPLSRTEIEAIRQEARIIHFNGGSKPWSYLCNHPRAAEYQRYLQMTEWRDFAPPDRTPLSRLRKSIRPWLPRKMKLFLRRISAQFGSSRHSTP